MIETSAFKTSFGETQSISTGSPFEKGAKDQLKIGDSESSQGLSFSDFLKNGIDTVNEYQKTADQMSSELAMGKQESVHETMIALSQAELSFNFMVQVRNKVLEAYQDVMRMQV